MKFELSFDLDDGSFLAVIQRFNFEEWWFFRRLVMAKLTELETRLAAISARIDEGQTELLAAIESLKTELADVVLPEGAELALVALEQKAQALADIIPNAPAEPDAPVDEPVA